VVLDKREVELLRLSARFLNRLSEDSEYANKFDKDPAAALQELDPQLARIPKKDIAQILKAYMKFLDAAFAAPEAKQLAAIPSGLLKALGNTKSFRATLAAREASIFHNRVFVANTVAASLAMKHSLVTERKVPQPE